MPLAKRALPVAAVQPALDPPTTILPLARPRREVRMDVGDVAITTLADGRVEVGASAGGLPLYFRLPAEAFNPRALGDALLLATLVPAMRSGGTLRLPPGVPVSSVLLAAVPGIQRIYRSWNARLREVQVESSVYEPEGTANGVGLFYAGGVDSSFSLLSHEAEVDTLVNVFGFDMHLGEDEMRTSRKRNEAFAAELGKRMLCVETNHRTFLREHGVSRMFVFGATLGSVALLLGFARCYLASNLSTAHMRPDGSHPLLDPRYSNGTTEIIHDDVSVTRFEKTRAIARRPDLLANLRVCWDYPNENCGTCLKCLRTMTALRLLQTPGPFPPGPDRASVRRMASHTELDFLVEMVLEAHRRGDVELLRELRRGLRWHDFREAVRHLLYAITGRKIRSPRGNGHEHSLVKCDLRPDLDLPRG